ncbi:flavin-containing monooxygenase [Acinetobacter sp. TGL-Y2]|uniref:flavin-containing monooxygenase n=1 Tax=Acinetobacter sp. TGL-Y2 TaxID=1407071 RepID=UPI001905A3BB|nr:NAD(P)/FAD-dependent oxidoreductase [Acinetobacter sp. TGL-Y2]MBJ9371990.1 NAD(P)/FAD-dependent oxidoreductase [Acinetobacter sp. TGL-Y2]
MTEHHEIVIVGAGFSGIGTAIALRKAGFEDIIILDDASGPGGVWHWNTYPGVAVDIPSFSYQFSFEQGNSWSRSYAPGKELKAYAEKCVAKYNLTKLFRFNTRVQKAVFEENESLYHLETSSGNLSARWLIHAGGPLSQPKLPDISGIESFKGKMMHTSRWDHSVDLTDKRVGIIGTGATAVQVIPAIAPTVKKLTVFQRTPIWCLPKPDFSLSSTARRGLKSLPGVKGISRLASQAFVELTFPVMAHYHSLIPGTELIEKAARAYVAAQVHDPAICQKLTPNYAIGCKRPSFHNTYLKTFNRDNVVLETSSIVEITPKGIRTSNGVEHELDVLILATGFKVTDKDALPTYAAFGRNGVNLADDWEENRLRSYQGITVAGFPNIFTIFGPYGYNGASFFTLIENSAAHIVRVLKEAKKRNAVAVEVKKSAQDAYMTDILSRKDRQVFANPSCQGSNSYYFTKQGDVPFRASTTLEAAWKSRHFDLKDYIFTVQEKTA